MVLYRIYSTIATFEISRFRRLRLLLSRISKCFGAIKTSATTWKWGDSFPTLPTFLGVWILSEKHIFLNPSCTSLENLQKVVLRLDIWLKEKYTVYIHVKKTYFNFKSKRRDYKLRWTNPVTQCKVSKYSWILTLCTHVVHISYPILMTEHS